MHRPFLMVLTALVTVSASCIGAVAEPAKKSNKSAPKPTLGELEQPMQVSLVRSSAAGCEPNCPEWIAAQGRIDAATPRKFKKVFAQLGKRQLPILIHSGGGNVDESLAIGRLIRAKGLDVAVSKTEVKPCAATDKACQKSVASGTQRGRPLSYRSLCASACAFVLAGGKRRFVSKRTLVGVHQLTSFETQIKLLRTYRIEKRAGWFGAPAQTKKVLVSEKRISEKTYEKPTESGRYKLVGKYFAEMGVTAAVMPLLMSATGKSMHWLSINELRDTNLATTFADGEQLLAGIAAIDATPPGKPALMPGTCSRRDCDPEIGEDYTAPPNGSN